MMGCCEGCTAKLLSWYPGNVTHFTSERQLNEQAQNNVSSNVKSGLLQ